MADQPEAPPLFGDTWKKGAGLLATGAGDDEKIVRVVDRTHADGHGSQLTRPIEGTARKSDGGGRDLSKPTVGRLNHAVRSHLGRRYSRAVGAPSTARELSW